MTPKNTHGLWPAYGLLALLALAAPMVAAGQRGRVITNDDMPASKDAAGSRNYSLQDHGILQVQVPDAWKDTAQSKQVPVTIVFSQSGGAPFQMTINVAWPTGAGYASDIG